MACCECGKGWGRGLSGSATCLAHPGEWRHFPDCPKPSREEQAYEENLGRQPVTRFPDDPDWRYKGGKKEFEERMREFGLLEEDIPAHIVGQEELF